MTPDEAESIFYAEYRIGEWKEPGKPLVQKELKARCWQKVIDAVRAEYAREIAENMLKGIERDATQGLPLG
jgi:hypothetical protein